MNLQGESIVEKLYNNIVLEGGFNAKPSDPSNVPYLRQPPEVIDVSVGRQLFVDHFLIEKSDLCAEYHSVEKYEENPIFSAEMPWETEGVACACPKSGGIFYDEEEKLFKMWYEGGWLHHMCYATSKDGIHWERPSLDFVSGTNIILPYEGYTPEKFDGDESYLRPDSTTVWIDYHAPKNEKYKLFLRNPGSLLYGIVGVSGDGIHFEKIQKTSPVRDRSTIFYNPFRKKWVYSIRSRDVDLMGKEYMRARRYRECDDYLVGATWQDGEDAVWMTCDALDLPDVEIGMEPQLYNVDAVGYESIMLGMFQIMYGPDTSETMPYGIPKITELMPMYSRDGYHFSRPSRKSLIMPTRKKGSWERGYVQSVGGITVIHGDELWIYYIGFSGNEQMLDPSWVKNGMYYGGALGLAKLRRDGFVSQNGKGSLLTRKLQFCGKEKLIVNAEGSVSVELLDENGVLLDRTDEFCGDSTCAELRFEKTELSALNGKTIRLRFLVDGKLYSFGFVDQDGDCGGAHAAGMVE